MASDYFHLLLTVRAIKKDNKLIVDKKEIAEVIANQVSKTYVESGDNEENKNEDQIMKEVREKNKEDGIDNFKTNEDEIREAIKAMKNSGTKDPMGIKTTIIKKLQKPLILVITKLANISFRNA